MSHKALIMPQYFVAKVPHANGAHEVHNANCHHVPAVPDRLSVGQHPTPTDAMIAAIKRYGKVNGCAECMPQFYRP